MIPGYSTYSFPTNPDVLFLSKEYRLEAKELSKPVTLTMEFVLRSVRVEVIASRNSPVKPKFMVVVNPALSGIERVAASSVASLIRRELYECAIADVIDPFQEKAIRSLITSFPLLPLPNVDVAVRIPVLLVREITYFGPMGSGESTERVLTEIRPQGYGLMVSTEQGLKELVSRIEHLLSNAYRFE